jgi:7,8-dihydroneopterin aldolase/epimerase/oxygenase
VTDRIELRGLRFAGICGVLPEERERRQPLEVDLDLVVDLTEAGRTDDLHATVDYGQVCADVEQVVLDLQPELLERLAQGIADAVLAHDGVEAVTVGVRKLRPPVPQQLATSGVRITRRAGDR